MKSELSKVEQFLRYSKITVICVFKKDDVTEMHISSRILKKLCNSFFLVKGYTILHKDQLSDSFGHDFVEILSRNVIELFLCLPSINFYDAAKVSSIFYFKRNLVDRFISYSTVLEKVFIEIFALNAMWKMCG